MAIKSMTMAAAVCAAALHAAATEQPMFAIVSDEYNLYVAVRCAEKNFARLKDGGFNLWGADMPDERRQAWGHAWPDRLNLVRLIVDPT
ncbi:MAG: hypothetical protein IJG13_15510 [Kiritimatiellae bacterium]|nr:hypothetical protein [Kiritimatiellia bacterium]MBQ6330688.1 hypothetical protein [Kiritimatiellia bacterium]